MAHSGLAWGFVGKRESLCWLGAQGVRKGTEANELLEEICSQSWRALNAKHNATVPSKSVGVNLAMGWTVSRVASNPKLPQA